MAYTRELKRCSILLFAGCFVLSASHATAEIAPGDPGWPDSYPHWWHDATDPANGLIDATRPILNTDNDAILNQGQLWNMLRQGIIELDTILAPAGGAGFALEDFREPGKPPDYEAPALTGQLKYASSKFFDRFAEIGFAAGDPGWPGTLILDQGASAGDHAPRYPWLSNTGPQNLAPARTGQAKHLFSWDIEPWTRIDSDNSDRGDGLPDWWELYYFGDLSYDGSDDFDGDGIVNTAEFVREQDPTLADENQDGVPDGESIAGNVFMERWELKHHPRLYEIAYHEREDVSSVFTLDRLEWNAGPVTYETSFGYRIRGYIIAPETGFYRFWVYGDDFVEFWLSHNHSPVNARRVAFNPSWNFEGGYEQYGGQSSVRIELQAGKRYYFDIFHYGDPVSDYFAVAWQYGNMLQPVVIEMAVLASYVWDADDLDDDGMADREEQLHFLDGRSNTGRHGRMGDLDGDGLSNFWELQRGLDPSVQNVFPRQPRAVLFPQVLQAETLSLIDWDAAEVGTLNQFDCFEQAGSVYLAAAGKDRFNFGYAYQERSAPFRMTSRVRFTAYEDTYAEAGIRICDSLDPQAAFYAIYLYPDGRVLSNARSGQMDGIQSLKSVYNGERDAVWLRVEYDGMDVQSAYSYDGVQWLELDHYPLNRESDLYVGLAVSSLDALEVVGAQFDGIEIDHDADLDGLWDKDEASYGTNPQVADTDGDGYSDYDELMRIGSDPLVFNGVQLGAAVAFTRGSEAAVVAGAWKQKGDAVHAMDYRGALEYPLLIPADGYYRLDITIREASPYRDSSCFKLNAHLNSLSLGTQLTSASYQEPATLSYWLPWTSAGASALILDWLNVDSGSSLQIDYVKLLPLSFNSEQSRYDWQVRQQSNEFAIPQVTQSMTSPFNFVGKARDPDLVTIRADSTDQSLTVKPALTGYFQSEITLKPSMQATQVELLYAGGIYAEEQSIQWSLTNLAQPTQEDAIIVRAGDRLLLGRMSDADEVNPASAYVEIYSVSDFETPLLASSELDAFYRLSDLADAGAKTAFLSLGEVDPVAGIEAQVYSYADGRLRAFSNAAQRRSTVAIGSNQVARMDAFGLLPGEVFTLKLENVGLYIIRCAWLDAQGNPQQALQAVEVPEIELGADFTSIVDFARLWVPDQLSAASVLVADQSVFLGEVVGVSPRAFRIQTNSEQSARIIARTHSDGPIADTVSFHPVINYSARFNYHLKVLDVFTDGTQLVEFDLAFGGELSDDFEVLIQPFKAGVTFDDGTLTRTIYVNDLDELGRYKYRLLLPADVPGSACHFYQIRQGNTPINHKI